ncbi:hypothetical protein E2C01_094465 [Portunus trituberculatus]|uniref:Uncharacterized protein n=1 Tax=Portunus trituberculatus TaxID=210409 RepID=A0A5B7JQH7_PORTR|nr:hypothetical protein [Portunus trituberculatus]
MLGWSRRVDRAVGASLWPLRCGGTLLLVQELQHQGLPGDVRSVCGAERASHRAEHLRHCEQTQALPDPARPDGRALLVPAI